MKPPSAFGPAGLALLLSLVTDVVGCATQARPAEVARVVPCPASLARLREGQLAPNFVGVREDGTLVGLSALRSRTVVLYFYPDDIAPVSTVERARLHEVWPQASADGAVVVGVTQRSPRAPEPVTDGDFMLVSDPDGSLASSYGRNPSVENDRPSTFVIGPDGTIENTYCVR